MTQQRSDRRERTWLAKATDTRAEARTTGSRKQARRTAEVEARSRDSGRTDKLRVRAGKRVWRGAEAGGTQGLGCGLSLLLA